MLTNEEALFEIDGWKVVPDKLIRSKHEHYLSLAEEMMSIFRNGTGRSRDELKSEVRQLFWDEKHCNPRRVKAFCKLLEDESVFDVDERGAAAKLRIQVLGLAASKHPIVVSPESLLEARLADVRAEIAQKIGRDWDAIENEFFRDVHELQRLKSFTGYPSAEALLTRYNEAQLQAALYRAQDMRILAREDYKTIIRAAKNARLMFTANRKRDVFEFVFDGPSSVLRDTTRYGVRMAQLLPTLLACRNWELRALIRCFPRSIRQPELIVTSEHRYRSSRKTQPDFDSDVEKHFSETWGCEARDGWILKHESEPQFIGQRAFFPDFTFEHETGVRVLFEIIGHWKPEYVSKKRDTLIQFRTKTLLLAIEEKISANFTDLGIPTVNYKKSLKLEPIIDALRRFI